MGTFGSEDAAGGSLPTFEAARKYNHRRRPVKFFTMPRKRGGCFHSRQKVEMPKRFNRA
jgi:hypothetical protein